MSIGGTKVHASAWKIRSVCYDHAKDLLATLTADIAGLMAQTKAADAEDRDPPACQAVNSLLALAERQS